MTYNLDSPLTWPEESLTQQVLTDEECIEFHVCINCFYNETAHYADIVLHLNATLQARQGLPGWMRGPTCDRGHRNRRGQGSPMGILGGSLGARGGFRGPK